MCIRDSENRSAWKTKHDLYIAHLETLNKSLSAGQFHRSSPNKFCGLGTARKPKRPPAGTVNKREEAPRLGGHYETATDAELVQV